MPWANSDLKSPGHDPVGFGWRPRSQLTVWLVHLFEGVDTSSLKLKLMDQKGLHNGSVILTYAPQ